MTSSVSFKVYLTNDDDRHTIKEVRRFGIDKDVSESFLYFREKLQTIFSSLRGRHFSVYWKDDDNDNIVVSSDEELNIAMGNDQAKAFKFYVTPHSDTPVVPPRNQMPQCNSGQSHPGIICDGCDKGIRGFRYNCIQCPDYDLCASCEAKGLHQEHCMIRIAIPMQWKSQYNRRFAHLMNRFAKKAAACEAKEEAQKKCPYRSNRHSRSHHHDPETPSWMETLLTYLNDWTNLPEDGHCSLFEKSEKASQKSKFNEGKKPEDDKKPLDLHNEFLKNLGDNISQILDPFGIDVNVQVRNDDVPVASPASNQDEKTPQAQQVPGENIPKFPGEGRKLQESPERESPAAKPSPIPPTHSEIVAEKPSLENEGWTVLNNLDGYPPVATPAVPAVNFPAPEPINASNGQMSNVPFSTNTPHLIPVHNIPVPASASASASTTIPVPTPITAPISTPVTAPTSTPVTAPTSSPVTIPFYPATVASTPGASHNNGAIPKQVPTEYQQDNPVVQKPIYPQLPNRVTYHSDPKIQASVEAMVQMGFKNENGWLTDLLVAKNGDISKVLDVLQPVLR
ncbi:sequestosome-1 [Cephus cinctus]|uniref:Sequestosome-1 n=1 Tax=Cephus cinctus TaxID=211228 RepID=A0AAJ7BTC9_CEPCN|nr:sequestosome-1 [Cephus cinctus]